MCIYLQWGVNLVRVIETLSLSILNLLYINKIRFAVHIYRNFKMFVNHYIGANCECFIPKFDTKQTQQ